MAKQKKNTQKTSAPTPPVTDVLSPKLKCEQAHRGQNGSCDNDGNWHPQT